ncbi:flotillin family protein [Fulvivirga sp. 29W222]|uniref:Flotillin family protein n=1 Tax=Fulvivirga marina TaxID=2494733 RepID=A0A937KCF4_9BACT|nr:flotillin family protein [Fulvivirga marina]MBL6447319.1 flotillin family protein [Fulvivirga marina]
MGESFIIIVAAVAVFIFVLLIGLFKRYKRCPSDRILVVYGKVGKGGDDLGRSAKCIHGGAAFIWPIIQDYEFLDLTPSSIEVNLTNALSRQNIRVDVPSRFTVGISTEEGVMNNAAERLLGLTQQNIHDLAKDIIFGQLRLVVATMDIEEINSNRDKFLANVASNVEAELKKIGLKLINVNVTDIKDESGYIEALGKEAAAKAINDARKSVAEKTRDGMIGEANAVQEQRVKVADADAGAVEGENLAKIKVAQSDASRREKEAEAQKIAIAAEKVQAAKALEEAYAAEQEAENARATRDKASQTADIVVPAEIDKQKVEIAAEAEAEMIRRKAKGEADAILFKKQAEAQGLYEVLTKQAQGLEQIVKAAGDNSKDAVLLLVADKLPELVRMQTEAIKNIKIDKITVWENGSEKDGKTSTANFISGMYKSVPPLQEMFNMAGMELPEYLKGKSSGEIQQMAEEVKGKQVAKTPDKPKTPPEEKGKKE